MLRFTRRFAIKSNKYITSYAYRAYRFQSVQSVQSVDPIPVAILNFKDNECPQRWQEIKYKQFNGHKPHSSGLVRLHQEFTNLTKTYLVPTTPESLRQIFRLDRKGAIAPSCPAKMHLLGIPALNNNGNMEKHREMRKLLNPLFMTESLRDRNHIIQFYGEQFMDSLSKETAETDEYIQILPKAKQFVFDAAMGVIFGTDIFTKDLSSKMLNNFEIFNLGFGDINAENIDKTDTVLRNAMVHRDLLVNDIEILIKQSLDLHEKGRLDQETIIYKMIKSKVFGSDFGDLTDFKNNILMILWAGHGATAGTICNLLYCLDVFASNPYTVKMEEELKENCNELCNFDFIVNNAALDAFIKEVLRYIPTVTQIPKQITRNEEIGGYKVEKGTNIMINNYMTAKQDCIFGRNADKFDPMRFMDHPPGKQIWYPFGLGSTMCLGSKLAFLELKTVSCLLFNKYKFNLNRKQLDKSTNYSSSLNFYDVYGKFYKKK